MNTEAENSERILEEKIRRLRKLTNLDRVIAGDKNSPRQIRTYFHLNRLAYRRFHSREGFMHFRISKNGVYHEEDVYYQPDVVESRIPRHGRVLELGFGQGANLFYLAERRPDAFFCGVDIAPTNPPRQMENLRLFQRNYADLSNFPSSCFDVVYAIETIVYVSEKDPVFREAFRVLKPGGTFIVYDYATAKPFEENDETIRTAVSLISKGGAGAVIESRPQWERHFQNAGFQNLQAADFAEEVLPDFLRLERKAARFLDRPLLSKLLFRLAPRPMTNNIILGYLAPDLCRTGAGAYMEWIEQKPRLSADGGSGKANQEDKNSEGGGDDKNSQDSERGGADKENQDSERGETKADQ